MTTITVNKVYKVKKLLKLYFGKYNKMPKLDWMVRRSGFEKELIIKIIKYLKKENFLYVKDDTIKINPKKQNYPKRKVKTHKKVINKAKTIFDNTQKINTTDISNWMHILRYVLLVIGIGAIYMSVYYSNLWLLDFLSPAKAFLLALIMVAFAVSAFELIVFFRQQKQYFLVIIFSVLWVIVTSFSMISTVAGQYNAKIKKLDEQYKKQSIAIQNQRQYNEYAEQKNEYIEQRKILIDDVRQLQNILSQYTTKEAIKQNQKYYNSIRWRYNQAKRQLNKIANQLKKLRTTNKTNKPVDKSSPDFYIWISNIFNWRPEMVQFWLSVFPALFIDLISPISIAIVMFVSGNKKE